MKQLQMKKYVFRHPDGTAKVWYVHYDDATQLMTTRWGKLGSSLQESARPTSWTSYQATINSKEKKGYERSGAEMIGDVPVTEDLNVPSSGVQKASKKFDDIALFWDIDKKAFSQPGWVQKCVDLIGGVSEVVPESNAVVIKFEGKELRISPEPSSSTGLLKPCDWEIGLLLFKLAGAIPIGFSAADNSVISKRNTLKSVFDAPMGFDELSEKLGLIPKMTSQNRDSALAFF